MYYVWITGHTKKKNTGRARHVKRCIYIYISTLGCKRYYLIMTPALTNVIKFLVRSANFLTADIIIAVGFYRIRLTQSNRVPFINIIILSNLIVFIFFLVVAEVREHWRSIFNTHQTGRISYPKRTIRHSFKFNDTFHNRILGFDISLIRFISC